MTHTSVMLKECIDALQIKENGIYIDGTLGRGGHSAAILAKLRLIVIRKPLRYPKRDCEKYPMRLRSFMRISHR